MTKSLLFCRYSTNREPGECVRPSGCRCCCSGHLLPGPASVNPRDGNPLRSRVDLLERALQDADRLVDVVVDDGQVKVVTVGLEEAETWENTWLVC